jgi:hypothetical protein
MTNTIRNEPEVFNLDKWHAHLLGIGPNFNTRVDHRDVRQPRRQEDFFRVSTGQRPALKLMKYGLQVGYLVILYPYSKGWMSAIHRKYFKV